MPGVLVTLAVTAACAALSYISFRRHRDVPLAVLLGLLVFAAFVAGSIAHPVELTAKRTSLESALATRVDGADRSLVALDQHSLDNLPNIPIPARGQIDFVGVRRGTTLVPAHSPELQPDEQVELRGSLADPLAGDAASGLFIIADQSRRIDESSSYGLKQRTTFVVDVPASQLHRGINELQIGGVATDQRGFYKLPDRVTVIVTER